MKSFYEQMAKAGVLPQGLDYKVLHAAIREQGRRRGAAAEMTDAQAPSAKWAPKERLARKP